jgi:hypothetical protein
LRSLSYLMANVTPSIKKLNHPRDKIFEGIPAESPEFTTPRRRVTGIIYFFLDRRKTIP